MGCEFLSVNCKETSKKPKQIEHKKPSFYLMDENFMNDDK